MTNEHKLLGDPVCPVLTDDGNCPSAVCYTRGLSDRALGITLSSVRKIERVIASCKTRDHLAVASRMVDLYMLQVQPEGIQIITQLRRQITIKESKIHA